jgi:phytanoyl-CoA hydroxylase
MPTREYSAPPSSADGTRPDDGYFPWDETTGVTPSARAFFEANGYAVFTSHADRDTTLSLRTAAAKLVRAHPPPPAAAPFSTVCDQARARDADEHFLGSAGTVRSFREEKANADTAAGDPTLTTNKIGHALHDLVPEFASFSYAKGVRAVAEGVLGLCRVWSSLSSHA